MTLTLEVTGVGRRGQKAALTCTKDPDIYLEATGARGTAASMIEKKNHDKSRALYISAVQLCQGLSEWYQDPVEILNSVAHVKLIWVAEWTEIGSMGFKMASAFSRTQVFCQLQYYI